MQTVLESFKQMICRGEWLVLDTETTGLDGQVIQIAVVTNTKKVLLDTLVRPTEAIPPMATAIHGITNADVANAPTWPDVTDILMGLLPGRNVVSYNAIYDRKMMHHSAEAYNIPKTDWKEIGRWYCAMEAFAEQYGQWNDYRHSYTWKKLSEAAHYYRIQQQGEHTALADCLTTVDVCWAMANSQ